MKSSLWIVGAILAIAVLVVVLAGLASNEPVPSPSEHSSIDSGEGGEGPVGVSASVVPQSSHSLTHTHQAVPAIRREAPRVDHLSLFDRAQEWETGPLSEVDFPLFEGETVQLTDLRHTGLGGEAGVFTGRVAGDPHSHVVLSYVGQAESGTIQEPARERYFELRAGANGVNWLTEVDASAIPPCALCLPGPE